MHAVPLEQAEQRARRVPVAVLGADADQAEHGAQARVERLVLVGRAVVGHLHDVEAARSHRVEALRERDLRRLAEVAEEERARLRTVDGEDDARVVARPRPRLGPEDPPSEAAELAVPAGPGFDRRHAAVGECTERPARAGAVGRAVQDGVDALGHGRDAPDVVRVPVREHEQIDAVDSGELEAAPERGRLGAGVDQHRAPLGSEQYGVALPDVAGHGEP